MIKQTNFQKELNQIFLTSGTELWVTSNQSIYKLDTK